MEESGEDSPVATVVAVTLVSLFLTLSVAAVIILVVWRWVLSNGKKTVYSQLNSLEGTINNVEEKSYQNRITTQQLLTNRKLKR